jgi:hypothetical protein
MTLARGTAFPILLRPILQRPQIAAPVRAAFRGPLLWSWFVLWGLSWLSGWSLLSLSSLSAGSVPAPPSSPVPAAQLSRPPNGGGSPQFRPWSRCSQGDH